MADLSCVGGVLDLAPRAEKAFRLEAECVGGYEIDPGEAVQHSAAANFLADCLGVLVDVDALGGKPGIA